MSLKIDRMFDISNKVIAVTGAAGIIYRSVAKALAANGAEVALLDIATDKVTELAEEINRDEDTKELNGRAIGVHCNVLNAESVQAALDAVVREFGRCDVLVNGAGGNSKGATVTPDGRFADLAPEEVDKVFALNYRGTFLPSQVFCRYFAQVGGGCIVNTSSMSALCPLTNVPGYSGAKAAVSNFTRWLAVQARVDYPDAEIRVNEIAPGFLDTTQNHFLLFEQDGRTLTRRGKSIVEHTPLGRFGDPAELVGALILLISDAGRFIHGATLCIDGGFSAYSGVGPLDEKK